MKCQLSVTTSSGSIAASGGVATLAVAAQPECAWTASSESSWIAEVNPSSGQGTAEIQVRAAPNPQPAMRQGSVQVNGSSVRLTQDAAGCRFEVSPTARAISSAGGSTTVAVTGIAGCTWTSVSGTNWITIGDVATGNGNGVVRLTASANAGKARVGTVTVAGQTVTLTQDSGEPSGASCVYTVAPLTVTPGISGGPETFDVTTTSLCSWTAASAVSWISIAGSATGTSSGTVSFTVATNPGAARSGTLLIAGQTVTVSQAANCVYSLSSTSQTAPAAGASNIGVSVTAGPGCSWTAVSNAAWLTITSGADGSGNGSVAFDVPPNPAGQRNGTLTIAGQTFTVTQSACSYSLGGSGQTVSTAGGAAAPVTVTTTPGCAWTASSNAPWIAIPSGTSGTGTGAVQLAVQGNTGAQRAGTVTIAGQPYTITQSACSYAVAGSGQTVGSAGGAATPVPVTTTASCVWAASSNAPWITVTSGATGTGNGTVGLFVLANTGPQRVGTATIAGQPYSITQPAPCAYSITPTSQSLPSQASVGTVITVTTAAGCAWSAVSNQPWITVTSGTVGSGAGTVGFSVAANPAGADRQGTLTIAGQIFTVIQLRHF